MKSLNSIKGRDYILCTVVAAAIFFYILLSSHLIGLVRDEGFYMRAAEITADWFEYIERSFSRGEFMAPFTYEAINRYFKFNHEHPALLKNMFGFSHYLFYKKLGLLSFVNSTRVVAALFAALTAAMIYLFGLLFYNRMTAIVAPVLFFTMPHIFFHSHLACIDMPVLFFWSGTFILFAVYSVSRSRKLALFLAVFYGCAMATKHNAFFIPILLATVWLLFYIIRYRNLEEAYRGVRGFFRAVPLPFYLFPVVSLPVYLLNWPWLWYNTVHRFISYLNFHTKHANYATYYFGQELAAGPLPFSFPWGMTFFTTPLPQLVLFFAGIALFIRMLTDRNGSLESREVNAYFLTASLFPILLIALPSVPIFGGIKHWFTGYPIMLTAGTAYVLKGGESVLSSLGGRKKELTLAAVAVCTLLSLMPLNIHFAKRGAAFFNTLIGGAQGAASAYMQRNFWGYDILDLTGTLNREAPANATLYVMGGAEGLNWNSFLFLKREGIIRRDIRGTNDIKSADFALFFYEKQNENVLYDIYSEFGTVRPLAISEVDSVLYSALFRRIR